MVGFDPAINYLRQNSKLTKSADPADPSTPEFPDFSLSFVDPFTDFDCIEDWINETDSVDMPIEENPCPDGSDSKRVEFGFSENNVEMPVQETSVENLSADASDTKMVEGKVVEELGNLGSPIEEKMGKFSLVVASENSDLVDPDQVLVNSESSECLPELSSKGITEEAQLKVNDDEVNEVSSVTNPTKAEDITDERDAESGEIASDGEDSDSSVSESESDSSSSSSSSSPTSSSEEEEEEKEQKMEEEDEEKEIGEVGEVEEGEIRDLCGEEIVGGSDEEEEGVMRGPIKSKNEVEVLFPVPQVDVSLEPHHQTLPVGVILSVMGVKVIVEGLEKHNPLNEGSILWITETRSPLGLVDEIFGPVKNPYYVVRYNSDKEVPAGIRQGTPVSFVAEFADHVLNDKNLFKKGYDASGENDEEVSEEAEFSDDEKEAEYKRMQRMTKKGADGRKRDNWESVDRTKVRHKGGARKNIPPPVPPAIASVDWPAYVPNQLYTPPDKAPFGCGSCACSFGTGPAGASGPGFTPPVSQVSQPNCCTPQYMVGPSNGVWPNGMPCQQQQPLFFSNGFPMNGMPYQQQNHHQHPNQMFMGFQNGMPTQQFDPSQRLMPNVALPYGQPNFSPGPSTSWPGFIGQAGFNQTPFGMGLQGHQVHTSTNAGEQGVLSNGLSEEQSNGIRPPPVNQGNFSAPHQFNQGGSSFRGRGPYRRGGGYFSGGKGRFSGGKGRR